MMAEAVDWLNYLMLLKWPYAGDLYLCSLVTSGHVNARGGKPRFEGMLLPMFMHTLLTTTGSGIVGPVLMRDPPLFLENDRLVTCIILFFFFAVVFDPYVVNFARRPLVWKAMTMLQTTSRMNKICLIVDYALKKFPPSPYYPVALFGPILIGLARGIGGTLVPCDKGVSCVRKGLPWKIQLCFTVAAFYHIVANDNYILGGIVRGALGLEDISRENVRLICVTFGFTMTLIQTFFSPEFNPFGPTHHLLYAVTGFEKKPTQAPKAAEDKSAGTNGNGKSNGEGAEEEKDADKEKDDGARELYNLERRKRFQKIFDRSKPAVVAAVAMLAVYSRQLPSKLPPGKVISASDRGLAACSFLPAPLRTGCEPLRAALTESGSLVIFKGGDKVPTLPVGRGKKAKPAEGEAEIVWSSPAPRKKDFEPEDVRLELSEDGILSVLGGEKQLWSSTLTPLGKRLPPFRVEARLNAESGALEVYKGGQLQWSSARKV